MLYIYNNANTAIEDCVRNNKFNTRMVSVWYVCRTIINVENCKMATVG